MAVQDKAPHQDEKARPVFSSPEQRTGFLASFSDWAIRDNFCFLRRNGEDSDKPYRRQVCNLKINIRHQSRGVGSAARL
jgi:hypothetical protein